MLPICERKGENAVWNSLFRLGTCSREKGVVFVPVGSFCSGSPYENCLLKKRRTLNKCKKNASA